MNSLLRSSLGWPIVLSAFAVVLSSNVSAVSQSDATGQAAANSAQPTEKESVKIQPYTGKPIFLEEAEVIAAPSIVRRETIKEQFKDTGKVRVEREVAVFSDDHLEAEGAYREYHPNGQLFVEGQFKNGRQDGVWTYFFENGQVNRKSTYADGKLNGSWDVFRADGTLSAKRSFKNGVRDGDWASYDATGKQPLTEEHYANGKETGVWKIWFPNGKQKQEFGFKDGVPDGKRTEWDETGAKRSEMTFVNGKVDGTATGWAPDGSKIVREFKDGRLIGESRQ